MFNYGLDNIRDKKELEIELEQEFRYKKFHTDKFSEIIAKQHEKRCRFLDVYLRQKAKKLDQIYFNKNNH